MVIEQLRDAFQDVQFFFGRLLSDAARCQSDQTIGLPLRDLDSLAENLDQFWESWGDAQSLLDSLPAETLSCLNHVAGDHWTVQVRMTLDRIAKWLDACRPQCGYPADVGRFIEFVLPTEPTDWSEPGRDLQRFSENLRGLRGGVVGRQGQPSRFTLEDFEVYAKPYIDAHVRKHGYTGKRLTVTKIAGHLRTKNPAGTCSRSIFKRLPSWIEYQKELKKAGNSYGRKPKAVPLNDLVLDNVGKRDEALARLMGEQERDFEPSPLVDGEYSVYGHKEI